MRIQQLSPAVANQIAAGEVIERPASVVKELLENALDAKADTITVEIGFGGLNQIKISDNGVGIVADDLPLAIAAHATSKITKLSDLYAITSMGFRGEALASIAAVSRLSLCSKPAQQEHAKMLRFEGSEYTLSPSARSQGTTVEVRDLFFNAPVRKKFLKTVSREFQAIDAVVKRFALSEPAIALTLKHNDKTVFALPAATCERTRLIRIQKLLGKSFIEQAIYIEAEQIGMRLVGWLSGHAYQRSQNDKQWFYINQRMVKDKLINHAIKQAYEPVLHPGRYPACVLYLTIGAEDVDVNVHPTKHEVRFQQPRWVHDFVSSHLSRALMPSHGALAKKSPVMITKAQEARERVSQPLRTTKSSTTPSWQILNKETVLMFLNNEPYLVDMVRVQQQRLLTLLHQQRKPLARRPLLVPVSHTMDKANRDFFEQHHASLAQLGVEFDWVGDTAIVVRTIPLLFPQLDMKQFLQRINRRDLSPGSDLSELMMVCQSFDAYQVNQEEMSILWDYLGAQIHKSAFTPGCVRLDVDRCRTLFETVEAMSGQQALYV